VLRRIKHDWDAVSAGLNRVTGWVCILLVLAMTAEVIVAVFFRYVLDAPIKWGEELARFLMVWAGLLGISIALKDGDHIGLEALTSRLRGRALIWCKLMASCVVAIFLVILLLWGIQISKSAWNTVLPALQIKWTWSHLAVPVTAAIQLVHLVDSILTDLIRLRDPERELSDG
jgi:TRAP-type C4-dicarboxylate transport system permease small subunit